MTLRLSIYLKRIIVPVIVWSLICGAVTAQQWVDPFPSETSAQEVPVDSMTLEDVLRKVSNSNPTRQEFRQLLEAASFRFEQAGQRPNPEIEFEAGNFGGDMPGFNEAEFSAGLSQEIELWGKRTHRKHAAQSETDAASLDVALADFGLYGETNRRYYSLVHAQNSLALAKDATDLAKTMTTSVESRMEHGAAMISELLLSELELQQARLEQAQKEYELASAQDDLASLWGGGEVGMVALESGLDPKVLKRLESLQPDLQISREAIQAKSQEELLQSQLNLQQAENKPNLTVSGGYKHDRADGTNSFIVGMSMPLPFFDRGQGDSKALQAESRAAEFARQQAVISAGVEYRGLIRSLNQFSARRKMIDEIILPQAHETSRSLREAYEKGKVIYSVLLQGEQTLIELRSELNDLDLAVVEQIIALELLLGTRLLLIEPK